MPDKTNKVFFIFNQSNQRARPWQAKWHGTSPTASDKASLLLPSASGRPAQAIIIAKICYFYNSKESIKTEVPVYYMHHKFRAYVAAYDLDRYHTV